MNLEVSFEQFESLFPKFSLAVGVASARKWMDAYFQAFPPRDWEAFECLRSFPMFLRNEKRLGRLEDAMWIDLCLWDWAEFASLYSPADEMRDRQSLKLRERMLNPTAQVVRLEFDLDGWSRAGMKSAPLPEKQMIFIFRVSSNSGFAVSHLKADWSTAAVADAFLESGRLGDAELIKEIESHHGTGHQSQWRERIQRLVEQRLVLEGA